MSSAGCSMSSFTVVHESGVDHAEQQSFVWYSLVIESVSPSTQSGFDEVCLDLGEGAPLILPGSPLR